FRLVEAFAPCSKIDTSLAQKNGDLRLSNLAARDSQNHFKKLIRVGLEPPVVETEKRDCGGEADALVSVDERMVLHQVKQVCRGHFVQGGVQILPAERRTRHRQGGLQQARIADST